MSELNNCVRMPEAHLGARLNLRVRAFTRPAVAVLSVLLLLALSPSSALGALDIASAKTAEHVSVPGMNAYFAPAAGLVAAPDFDGFESKNRKIEVIVAYIAAPINNIEEGFTEASFKARGMALKSSGKFTIDGRRAVLYKVVHDDGATKWGKWVMLAENGAGTLVVNAVFVSGDAAAAADLEKMLKGVYMEPVSVAAAKPGDAQLPDASGGQTYQESRLSAKSADSVLSMVSADYRPSFDRKEALSILARDIDTAAQSEDKPAAKGSARIITEGGEFTVVSGMGMKGGEVVSDDISGDAEKK